MTGICYILFSRAVTNIVKSFGVESAQSGKTLNGSDCICEANIVMLYDCYLTCMDDYTVIGTTMSYLKLVITEVLLIHFALQLFGAN